MRKDFSEFIDYWHSLDIQAIQDAIIEELNSAAKERNIPAEDISIWHIRSFNAKLTMKMLEEYHNWLND